MQNVFITGASTGLGLAIAELFHAQTPYRLILTARESSLARFDDHPLSKSDRVVLLPLDVLSKEERRHTIGLVNDKYGGVDILINNAGFAYRSVIEHVEEENRLVQLGVNFRAPMGLIRLVLPGMRKRRYGRIINISSVGGMMAMPTMGIYSASKFALEGASEALYYEVRPWNVKVTLVEPGFINSEGFRKVRSTDLSGCSMVDESQPYYSHYKHMSDFISKVMKYSPASSCSVARKVLKIATSKKPPLRVAGTFDAHLFDLMKRVLPRRVYHELLYRSLPKVKKWGTIDTPEPSNIHQPPELSVVNSQK